MTSKWIFVVHDGIWTQNHGIELIRTQTLWLGFELFIMVQILVPVIRNLAIDLHWTYVAFKIFYILSTVVCIIILDVLSSLYYHYTCTVLLLGYWHFDVMPHIEIRTNRCILLSPFFLSVLLYLLYIIPLVICYLCQPEISIEYNIKCIKIKKSSH